MALISHLVLVIDGRWILFPVSLEFIGARGAWAAIDRILTVDQHNRAFWLSSGVTALSLLGMLTLSDWARWTALFVTVFNLAWWPMAGTQMYSPWNETVYGIWNVCFSVALAIAFLSPVALHFTGQAEIPGTIVDD